MHPTETFEAGPDEALMQAVLDAPVVALELQKRRCVQFVSPSSTVGDLICGGSGFRGVSTTFWTWRGRIGSRSCMRSSRAAADDCGFPTRRNRTAASFSTGSTTSMDVDGLDYGEY